jgi:hypothetical protein
VVLAAIGSSSNTTTGGATPGPAAVRSQPEPVANQFLTLLRDGRYAAAYALCTPELQEELGDVDGLQSFIEDNDVQPARWSITDRTVEADQATFDGEVTLVRNRPGTVSVVLDKAGEKWLVSGLHLEGD